MNELSGPALIVAANALIHEVETASPSALPDLVDRMRQLVARVGRTASAKDEIWNPELFAAFDRFLSVGAIPLPPDAESGLIRVIDSFAARWLSPDTSDRFEVALKEYTNEYVQRFDKVKSLAAEVEGMCAFAELARTYLEVLDTLEPGVPGTN